MTSPENAQRLAEIAARLEAATPGPWTVHLWNLLDSRGNTLIKSYSDDAMFDRVEDAEFCANAKQDILRLLEVVRNQQRVIDCNSDDSDYEISLLKAESMEFRHIAMRALSAGHILSQSCPKEAPCRDVAEKTISEEREKLLVLIRRGENPPKTDNILANLLDNKTANNLDND